MTYRMLRAGEVVLPTDQYESANLPGRFIPVKPCTVGQELLACNVGYYRRPTGDAVPELFAEASS